LQGKRRYEAGLGRLDGTRKEVSRMQQILVALQPKLLVAAKDVEGMFLDVQQQSEEATEIEQVVKKDEEAAMVRAVSQCNTFYHLHYLYCCYHNYCILIYLVTII